MVLAVGVLSLLIIILLSYVALVQWQLHSINRQLDRRLTTDTRQPVSVEFINRQLTKLTSNINKCLKAEETLRLESVREEKKFKELIANISHDLRTPLTAVKGYQQLLERDGLTEVQKKKLKTAQKYSDELGNLIEQFFQYSYLLNAELKVNPERINLTNLVTECLAASVSVLEDKGIAVILEEAPPVFVTADLELTTRIIQNLIRNCAVHSSGDVKVTISGTQRGKMVFENPVSSPENIDATRLFDRFYTGDKARSKASTGLGLSIVKLLSEQMGGEVSAALQGRQLSIQVELPCKVE